MTQAELRFLSVVPSELRDICNQLEELNKNLATIAKALSDRRA